MFDTTSVENQGVSHIWKKYFKLNRQHQTIYIQKILELNLDCFVNNKRKKLRKHLLRLESQDLRKIKEMMQDSSYTSHSAIKSLRISSDVFSHFDPEFYKKVMLDIL